MVLNRFPCLQVVMLFAGLATSADAGHHHNFRSVRDGNNVTELLVDAQRIMKGAANAILSTHALSTGPSAGFNSDINSRMMSPKPVSDVTGSSSLPIVYIDTNKFSRKYTEIQVAIREQGVARGNLLYYDRDGAGYVAFRGNLSIADESEAKRQWWEGWSPFFPQKENTSFYAVIRFQPDWLEMASAPTQSGRADWLPISLQRSLGVWEVVVPAVPPSPVPPSPAPPSPSPKWTCSVCMHVYDPQKDGGGKAFEELPDSWVCPVCGAPKSSYKKTTLADGIDRWVHEELV